MAVLWPVAIRRVNEGCIVSGMLVRNLMIMTTWLLPAGIPKVVVVCVPGWF